MFHKELHPSFNSQYLREIVSQSVGRFKCSSFTTTVETLDWLVVFLVHEIAYTSFYFDKKFFVSFDCLSEGRYYLFDAAQEQQR